MSDVVEIHKHIHTIRGLQVMLDSDLATIYGVETKQFNQAVKRNKERFPQEFMFQLTQEEFDFLRSQIVTSSQETLHGGRRYSPFVFTEQGVAMLSAVLRSKTAINVSIKLMNAFVNMRRFLSQNASLFERINKLELKQLTYDEKFDKIFKALENHESQQGIFYDGQVFDAFAFISKIINNAKKQIILVDNYVDETTLTILSKKNPKVQLTIFTKDPSEQLLLASKKFNEQYNDLTIKSFNKSHDRFLLIDDEELYHIGASLKDLGKKWFAFSKIDTHTLDLVERLK